MSNIIVPKFPEVYIPTWREMEAETRAKIGGELMWELIDTRNFSKPVVVKKGKQKNMILGAMIDYWLKTTNSGTNYLGGISNSGNGHVKSCVLGTGTTAPARDQTALVAQIGNEKIYQTHTVSPDYAAYGVYTETTYEFQENECNGDLTEWGIKSYATTGSLLCRELFRDENGTPVVLTKTNSQVLRMTYRLYAQRTSDYSQSEITCGETTHVCKAYMVDKNLGVLLGLQAGIETLADKTLMPSLWYSVLATQQKAYLGTSNIASSPNDDVANGAQIKAGKVSFVHSLLSSISDYVDGSYERELIIPFAGNEANMSIGEIVCSLSPYGNSQFCRITFDPPIVKDSSKKLKVGVTLAITL